MGSIEQRKHARIETSLECTVVAGEADFPAQVENLSRGGAGLLAPPGKTKLGDSVMLLLERPDGNFSLAIPAQVLRVTEQDGDCLYGVHFEAIPPDVDEELARLLKALAEGRGVGRRESPRVSSRIRVKCKSPELFAATLNDLSRGGLSVRCPRDLEPGSTLVVQFGLDGHPGLVEVSGSVLRTAQQPDASFLVSLRFDPPTLADKERVLKLVQDLLDAALPEGLVLEDED